MTNVLGQQNPQNIPTLVVHIKVTKAHNTVATRDICTVIIKDWEDKIQVGDTEEATTGSKVEDLMHGTGKIWKGTIISIIITIILR